jgi:hypothetical protein
MGGFFVIDSRFEYNKRLERYELLNERLVKQINWISHFRLLTGVIGFGGGTLLLARNEGLLSAAVLLPTLILFIYLVVHHDKLKQQKSRIHMLCKTNQDSIRRLDGEWTSFEDTGAEFQDPEHDFSDDLDIFGRNSLFQWINTAVTYSGRNALQKLLANPSKEIEDICKRQEAAKELACLLDFRQGLQAEASLSEGRFLNPEVLYKWAEDRDDFYRNPVVLYMVRILPFLTILSLIGAFVSPFIPPLVPFLLVIAQIGLLAFRFVSRSQVLGEITSFAKDIKAYRAMLYTIEKQEFCNEYLKDMQNRLKNANGEPAYKQIQGLERVLDRIGIRHSQLYLIINILFLWDYQCITVLEQWRTNSGQFIENWVRIMGEMEALSSLAVLYYDYPEWATPIIYNDQPRLFGAEVGHPLLPPNRVNNDISMMKRGYVNLITGSNMSGKSTLLRTVGINLVLAYAGAPVCAKEFHCSVFHIYTSMRVRDDLEKNISSFYAELLRIKRMIEAAKKGEQVFFLLDEIFKGTNSRDRHTGARILIKQLSEEGAIGFVSTHDVELGDLATENSEIKNYHFREYYKEGQLYFDFKLRKGVSNTRNAIFLMKMAGITVKENNLK